jgi:uncharacterized protein YoxC
MLTNIANWGTIASVGLNILILLVSIAGFLKVMKNDLFHVQKSLDEIKSTLKEISNEVCTNGERLAKLEGKCKANHG